MNRIDSEAGGLHGGRRRDTRLSRVSTVGKLLALPIAVAAIAATGAQARGPTFRDGAWSYFGDPRAVYSRGKVFIGWVSAGGHIRVGSVDLRTGRRQATTLYRLFEDDHNNPSLLVRPDGRIMAFWSPHSGYGLPPRGIPSRMYWRVSTAPGSIARFGGLHRLRTNTRGKLGYTYPNPVRIGNQLWLFWRGADWDPTFSISRDWGRTWTRARTLVRGTVHGRRQQRPYAKYASDGQVIDAAFTNAHPLKVPTGISYLRYRAGHFYRADGRRVGSMRDLPIAFNRADKVYDLRSGHGRAWVQDTAIDSDQRPVIVYVRRERSADVFRYARWTGRRWTDRRIVSAGRRYAGMYTGGVTLDHETPSVVYVSRLVGRRNEVEVWVTPDGGASWGHRAVTSRSRLSNIRPVSPRGLVNQEMVIWLYGSYFSWSRYHTSVLTDLRRGATEDSTSG